MSDGPQQRLEADLIKAMKARDRHRVDTLRMLLTAVKNRRIEAGIELTDRDFVALVKRALKQRRESATIYRDAGRPELAEKEEAEIEILDVFLPTQIDEDTLRSAVEQYLEDQQLSGMPAMGQVMKAMMAQFGERADGQALSGIVRQLLSR